MSMWMQRNLLFLRCPKKDIIQMYILPPQKETQMTKNNVDIVICLLLLVLLSILMKWKLYMLWITCTCVKIAILSFRMYQKQKRERSWSEIETDNMFSKEENVLVEADMEWTKNSFGIHILGVAKTIFKFLSVLKAFVRLPTYHNSWISLTIFIHKEQVLWKFWVISDGIMLTFWVITH